MRQRRQRRRQLDDVDARQRTLLRDGQLQRADAFDRRRRRSRAGCLRATAARRRAGCRRPTIGRSSATRNWCRVRPAGTVSTSRPSTTSAPSFGAPVKLREREPVGQAHGQRRGRALDHRDVEDRRDAQVVLADGDERLDVVEEPQRADRRGRARRRATTSRRATRRPAPASPRRSSRPCARARRVTSARSMVRSDPSPGASIVARIVPAPSCGSCAEARPGSVAMAPAHSICSVNGAAPAAPRGTRRAAAGSARPRSRLPGPSPGRAGASPRQYAVPAQRARISVPPESSGTRGRPVAQDLALQGDRAAQQIAVDAQREIGLRDEGARRRHGDGDGGIGGAIDQAVVLGEADRDGVRRGAPTARPRPAPSRRAGATPASADR